MENKDLIQPQTMKQTTAQEEPATQAASIRHVPRKPSQTYSGVYLAVILSISINSLILFGVLSYYDNHRAIKVQTVDLREYLNEMRKSFVSGKISQEQMKQSFNALDAKLKQSVEKNPNTIILLKEVIVSGKVDEIKP